MGEWRHSKRPEAAAVKHVNTWKTTKPEGLFVAHAKPAKFLEGTNNFSHHPGAGTAQSLFRLHRHAAATMAPSSQKFPTYIDYSSME
jgi:hypothetical protein